MVRVATHPSFLPWKDGRLNLLKKSWKRRGEGYWEIYIILLIAGILRLYRLDTSEFSGDQTFLLRLAYDAVHYSLIPATSNGSSIHTANAPMAVYFLMIPALFSPDPLWATVMTALFNVAAVLLTYIFTRRYFGRLAATIAALLYATSRCDMVFSRFMWEPSVIVPVAVLFMFALFWGAVERRKGWLFPAMLLLGVLVQLHEITILLAVPLLVAILLAPKTIRLRDIVFGFISLLVIYDPLLVWEVTSKFSDIPVILIPTKRPPVIDDSAFTFYKRFLNAYYDNDNEFLHGTYYDPTGSAHSAVFKLLPILVFMRYILELCLSGGFALAVGSLLRPQHKVRQDEAAKAPPKKPAAVARFFSGPRHWWTNLRADPKAGGLLLLLLWQIVPVLALTRHGPPVQLHYLLMIVPGPFIFIGIFLTRLISWFLWQEPAKLWTKVSYATYALTALILVIQLLGSSALLVDTTNAINNHIFGYNGIGSLEHASQEADHVAQEHHLSRVYVTLSTTADYDSLLLGFPYLASQMHTPATLFESNSCLVLPSPGEGSAVILPRSTDTLALALLSHFATATLVDEPPVLGSTPFKLSIVTPMPFTQPATPAGFAGQLQLIDSHVQQLGPSFPPMSLTPWHLLLTNHPAPLTTSTPYLDPPIAHSPD